MKRKFFAGAIALLLVASGVFAEKIMKQIAATDVYAKRGSVCTRLVDAVGDPSVALRPAAGGGIQATIIDNALGQTYTLWEDATCTNTPLYFYP